MVMVLKKIENIFWQKQFSGINRIKPLQIICRTEQLYESNICLICYLKNCKR